MPEQTDASRRIAFIGLGAMGGPMVNRLVRGGHEVHVYDVSAESVQAAASDGAKPALSAAAAVSQAEVTILMLPNSDIVEGLIDEVAADLARGSVVVDMSSSEPLRTRELSQRLATQDVTLLDAPVSGGVGGARGGTLTIMLGGDGPVVETITPLLGSMGTVRHVGNVGAGHALKALNNLMSATHLLVSSEALLAGKAFGLDLDTMLEVVNSSSGRSGSTQAKWPNFIRPETYDSGFALRLMVKDMKIAVDLIHQLRIPASLSEASMGVWDQASAELDNGADHTEIARWLGSVEERRLSDKT